MLSRVVTSVRGLCATSLSDLNEPVDENCVVVSAASDCVSALSWPWLDEAEWDFSSFNEGVFVFSFSPIVALLRRDTDEWRDCNRTASVIAWLILNIICR